MQNLSLFSLPQPMQWQLFPLLLDSQTRLKLSYNLISMQRSFFSLFHSQSHRHAQNRKTFTLPSAASGISPLLTLASAVRTQLVLQCGVKGQGPPRPCDTGDGGCLLIGSLCFKKSSIDLGTREKSMLIQRDHLNQNASHEEQIIIIYPNNSQNKSQ